MAAVRLSLQGGLGRLSRSLPLLCLLGFLTQGAEAQIAKIQLCQPSTNSDTACLTNPNSPTGEPYARIQMEAGGVATCYNQYAVPVPGTDDEEHFIRCYSPSINRGVTADASGGPREGGCKGSWTEAKEWCEALSITSEDPANSDQMRNQLLGAALPGQVVDDWRLARTMTEAGTQCGSGCQGDFEL
eukprot:CAMPEP_0118926796 /NCGR_PEP_ID=MMETSP1169-20130426/4415_1 /TAXON_ID=36882 /ORGANISM="Pyramimonas obovata, Strain CCMP722" /LENGTH=186 /DNA_ID=CAMNT_0006868425 /DNA_START=113 /DNA_END=669 /DNA_ORIENTATION=-